MNMTLDEYQMKAMSTRMDSCRNLAYMLTGLTAEVGEVNDKIAKAIRKSEVSIDYNELIKYRREGSQLEYAIVMELGDCLWFLAGLADVFGYSLDEIAEWNIAKLASRQRRGVIDGNGDDR